MTDQQEAALLATLKGNKGLVQSEYMAEDEAQQELDRVVGELNDAMGSQFIKLGKSATVNRSEVISVALTYPPSFA